jgi:hypothetical protein
MPSHPAVAVPQPPQSSQPRFGYRSAISLVGSMSASLSAAAAATAAAATAVDATDIPSFVPAHARPLWSTLRQLEIDSRELAVAEPLLYARYATLFATVCAHADNAQPLADESASDSSASSTASSTPSSMPSSSPLTSATSTATIEAIPLAFVVRVWRSFVRLSTPFAPDYARMIAVLLAFGRGDAADALIDAQTRAEFRLERPNRAVAWLHVLRTLRQREDAFVAAASASALTSAAGSTSTFASASASPSASTSTLDISDEVLLRQSCGQTWNQKRERFCCDSQSF